MTVQMTFMIKLKTIKTKQKKQLTKQRGVELVRVTDKMLDSGCVQTYLHSCIRIYIMYKYIYLKSSTEDAFL